MSVGRSYMYDESSSTESGSLVSDAKWKKWNGKEEDVDSFLTDNYSETSTIVASIRASTSSTCEKTKYSKLCPTVYVPPNRRTATSNVTLGKLRFRIRYALDCIRYSPSDKNGLRPSATTFRVERNWWSLKDDNWLYIDPTVMRDKEAERGCAKLLECIRFGVRSTRERALDCVGHLAIKYGVQLKPILSRVGAIKHINDVLSERVKNNAPSSEDTLALRCRRTLQALQYTDGCDLFNWHLCITNMNEEDEEAREAANSILQRIRDIHHSFIAVRITTATIYNKPALIPEGFFDMLHELLDYAPMLHDPIGMDDLYGWALENYRPLTGTGGRWPYTTKSLESPEMLSLKRLMKTLCSKEYASYLKTNMPNTHRIATILQPELIGVHV